MPTTGDLAADLVASLDRFLEADLRRRKLRTTAAIERALEVGLARAWRRQGNIFVAKLSRLATRFTAVESTATRLLEAIAEDDWLPLFDATAIDTLEAFVEPMTLQTQRALLAGARGTIADLRLGTSFDVANPAAIHELRFRAVDRVAGINATTREDLRRTIADGVANRKSYGAIARDIKGKFSGFGARSPLKHIASRAELVAVTEIGDAYEIGNRDVVDHLASAGLVMEKQWLDVHDGRVDPVCKGNAGQGWIPLDQAFQSGHQQPTAHPGCRCTTQYRRQPSEA